MVVKPCVIGDAQNELALHTIPTVSYTHLDVYKRQVIEHPSGKKKPYALYQAEKQGRPTRDNVARQAVDEAISLSLIHISIFLSCKSVTE